ncbi:MAG TPA: hypothetical protein VIS48_15050 [Candidatus Kryptonia bacterium]
MNFLEVAARIIGKTLHLTEFCFSALCLVDLWELFQPQVTGKRNLHQAPNLF